MASFGEFSGRPLQHPPFRHQSEFPIQSDYILEENPDDDYLKRYMGTGVGIASLIVENLVSHPFMVLRRQCQVRNNSRKYHLVPITLAPVVVHLHRRQGLTTLWKGIGSVCMVKGISLAVEDFISKVTTWPKDISNSKSVLKFCQHIFLKSLSIAIVTPFYCASFVETVQSDIASDKPGFLDVFKDGALRALSWGSPGGRLLPIWSIMMPTVMMGVTKYMFTISIRSLVARALRFRQKHIDEIRGIHPKDSNASKLDEIDMNASLTSMIICDIMFFPMETIIHRLYLQGTRTIIDDLDTGNSVLPVLTGYEGFFDCYTTIVNQEGFLGLYKGIGAMVLQFTIHVAVIRITQWVIVEVTELFKPAVKPALTASSSQQSLYSQQRYLFN